MSGICRFVNLDESNTVSEPRRAIHQAIYIYYAKPDKCMFGTALLNFQKQSTEENAWLVEVWLSPVSRYDSASPTSMPFEMARCCAEGVKASGSIVAEPASSIGRLLTSKHMQAGDRLKKGHPGRGRASRQNLGLKKGIQAEARLEEGHSGRALCVTSYVCLTKEIKGTGCLLPHATVVAEQCAVGNQQVPGSSSGRCGHKLGHLPNGAKNQPSADGRREGLLYPDA
eukprot:1146856-Pelagomonas_calceolata.AAC.7